MMIILQVAFWCVNGVGRTYIIEMFGGLHDEGCSLTLVILHPALSKELPVKGHSDGVTGQQQVQQIQTHFSCMNLI